ncbi:hypothetical protein Taro_045951 [Colocasia esculenta]|uniref:Uncharacterized protein n=1 Tax=Colocasia esculenta TaxID=4460 RepID=A0A843WSJ2_COLES|nr:hypothetical protein [Colocasia esculenta]
MQNFRTRRVSVRVATGSSVNVIGPCNQIATGSSKDRDGSIRSAARMRRGILSRSDHDRFLCHDGLENAVYRAVAFSGTSPEFEREKD